MSQQEQVVITRRAKPAAVMVRVEGKDWEEVVLQTSAMFWKLIEERRKQPDDVGEGAKNPTEETQEIRSDISTFREFSKCGSDARNDGHRVASSFTLSASPRQQFRIRSF